MSCLSRTVIRNFLERICRTRQRNSKIASTLVITTTKNSCALVCASQVLLEAQLVLIYFWELHGPGWHSASELILSTV